ncbi:ABC transporter ATP-binding protein [Neorhizobium sp. P12A]|uniref:ABC transporter ATP-binding protein n=1 Tax=Neorhizobium sp. P12A TaxID=2268027 RepID=UPI0011EE99F7|nr:ABC transporter ATP-binding protein [Neorhizobium sp. P12A]KAA0685044.1 ABC transporter ATP-binding protein [Neorhizobium sp. P12A]
MQDDIVVRVQQLNKKFNRDLKRSFASGVRALICHPFGHHEGQLSPGEFWALRNINLELSRGEALGLVGNNGSGKTTLLRLIAGLINPTSGIIKTTGKIAPMLALGAGFEPGLSGAQNIYLNMSLLGMTTDEIRARYDEVVDFAEIGQSISAPLGTYSTGMRMRLGFACAVHTDPQLLIVDEVLAVGDANFRVKCRNKINDIRRSGASLILVSHSRLSIEYLADRAIYLRAGQIEAQGDVNDVLDAYDSDQARQMAAQNVTFLTAPRVSTKQVTIDEIRLLSGSDDHEIEQLYAGEDLTIEITVTTEEDVEECSFNVVFEANSQTSHYHPNSTRDEKGWVTISKGTHTVRLHYVPVIFLPGTYALKISVTQGRGDVRCQNEDMSIKILKPLRKTIRAQYIPPLSIDLAGLQETEVRGNVYFEGAEDL